MNRTCNGKLFKVNEEWYWRCLMDGVFSKADPNIKPGSACPTCKRPITVTFIEVDTRIKVIQQICLKDRKDWFDFQVMILPM